MPADPLQLEPREDAAPAESHEVVRAVAQAEVDHRRYQRWQAASLIILASLAVLGGLYVAKTVLIVLLVSILLAYVLAPLVDFLGRLRVPRPVGSLIAIIVLCAAFAAMFYTGYNRGVAFIQDLPKYSGKIRQEVLKFRRQAETIRKTTEHVLPADQEEKNSIKVQQTTSWSDRISERTAMVTELIFLISFIPFLAYFMLSWQEHVRSQTVMLFKLETRNTAYVTLGLISAMIRSFIVGNFVVGLFLSGASMFVFALLGIPYFYFIGVLSGFLSLVPYLGVVLALFPPILAGLGQIGSEDVFIIILAVFSLHVFALNVLYPKIIGKRLQLNPLAVTIALMFWGWLWGAWGLILAVPITAAMKIIFDHVDRLRPYGAWLGE